MNKIESPQLRAYLSLERAALAIEETGNAITADMLRDEILDTLWYALTSEEHDYLNHRTNVLPVKWGVKVGEPVLYMWEGLPDTPNLAAIGRWWGAPTTFTSKEKAEKQAVILNTENPLWTYYAEEYHPS